jgi:hypothetical protein
MDTAEKLTSRCRNVWEVPMMDEEQALQLLKNKLDGSFDEVAGARKAIATTPLVPAPLGLEPNITKYSRTG